MHEKKPLTTQELIDNKVPLFLRDNCSGYFPALAKCRKDEGFWPWQCEHEKHALEVCYYKEYQKAEQLKREKINSLK